MSRSKLQKHSTKRRNWRAVNCRNKNDALVSAEIAKLGITMLGQECQAIEHAMKHLLLSFLLLTSSALSTLGVEFQRETNFHVHFRLGQTPQISNCSRRLHHAVVSVRRASGDKPNRAHEADRLRTN